MKNVLILSKIIPALILGLLLLPLPNAHGAAGGDTGRSPYEVPVYAPDVVVSITATLEYGSNVSGGSSCSSYPSASCSNPSPLALELAVDGTWDSYSMSGYASCTYATYSCTSSGGYPSTVTVVTSRDYFWSYTLPLYPGGTVVEYDITDAPFGPRTGRYAVGWEVSQSPENGTLSPADDLVINVDTARSATFGMTAVEVEYSLDGTNWQRTALTNTNPNQQTQTEPDHWTVNLGKFESGSRIQYSVYGTDLDGTVQPLAQSGQETLIAVVSGGPALQWLGNVNQLPVDGELDPNEDLWLNCETWPSGSASLVEAVYSVDGGLTWSVATLTLGGQIGNNDSWQVNLGSFATGATVEYVLVADDAYGTKIWDNNDGPNYTTTVNPGDSEMFVGNTVQTPPAGELNDGEHLLVSIESWPAGAATEANVVYSTDGWSTWQVVPMNFTGQAGNNDVWEANLGAFSEGTTVRYAVWVIDGQMQEFWDNNGGSNYVTVVGGTASFVTQSPANGELTSLDELLISFEGVGTRRGLSLVEIVYSLDGGATWLAAPLELTVETDYDHWEVNLGSFDCGTEIQYVLVSTDAEGSQEWFNNGGSDYTAVLSDEDFVNQVIPVSGPSPNVTVSGEYTPSRYPGWHAFDGSDAMVWVSELYEAPAWAAYEFAAPTQVDRYTITFNNGYLTTRAPRDFELQGWNGSVWVTLDSRTGETNWGEYERRSYGVASPGEYVKYRLLVTQDNDSRSAIVTVSIGEIRLEQTTCP